jgi:hypothetical protein
MAPLQGITALNREPPERPRMLFKRLSFRTSKTFNLAARKIRRSPSGWKLWRHPLLGLRAFLQQASRLSGMLMRRLALCYVSYPTLGQSSQTSVLNSRTRYGSEMAWAANIVCVRASARLSPETCL